MYRDGALAEQRKDYGKAEQYYRRALDIEPRFEHASVALAALLQATFNTSHRLVAIFDTFNPIDSCLNVACMSRTSVGTSKQSGCCEAALHLRRLTHRHQQRWDSCYYGRGVSTVWLRHRI
jgi:hypothetical protein